MSLLAAISLAAVQISLIGEIPIRTEGLGLSGLAWKGGGSYLAVDDRTGNLHPLAIALDQETGRPLHCELSEPVHLEGRKDLESVVWDAARACVWVGDEKDGSVRAFLPLSGKMLEQVELPACYSAFRSNYAIEAMALHPNGREFWICNEDALSRKAAVNRNGIAIEDGALATRERGSLVRLQKFIRTTPTSPWGAVRQFAYETDSLAGADLLRKARSGVSELCCLEDGTLLVLEREFSIKANFRPTFRCRIYEVDTCGATETTGMLSLLASNVKKVGKNLVFEADTGFTMYESLCLGPALADGSRVLVLISDAGEGSAAKVMTLKLRQRVK